MAVKRKLNVGLEGTRFASMALLKRETALSNSESGFAQSDLMCALTRLMESREFKSVSEMKEEVV